MSDLTIVVPLYNEQESVVPLLREIEQTYAQLSPSPSWRVILVDDSSTDETLKVALKARSSKVSITVIALQRNSGQCAAMQAGIDAADSELIATIDGDLQNDPADIPRMVEALQARELDLLVGRRAGRQDKLLTRKIPSWLANRLIARVTGVDIRDYGCSLKIYRTSVLRHVKLLGEMHRFIPAWMSLVTSPKRIAEMDVNHRARQFGVSKYGISRTIRVILDLVSVVFFMRFRARPGHFFGMIGLAIGAAGTVMLGIVMVAKFEFGQDVGTRPMLLIGACTLLASVQMIATGILAEILSRVYYSSPGNSSYIIRDIRSSTPTVSNSDRDEIPPLPLHKKVAA